uniref:leucine-rich repeat-containing protein 52 n=1 Tax=Pristiophorus japonicus TaxID=55135 RepID=UPI00398ED34E
MGVMLAAECPPKCICEQLKVNCRDKDLKIFPKDLPLNTRLLDVAGNGISEINSLELSLLSDLVHLDCSNNAISEISNLDFLSVVKLVYLDLSHNRLSIIDGMTFESLTNLIVLKLNDNPELKEIESDAFKKNLGLREINLSNNALSYLNTTTLKKLEGLKVIYLAGNPWDCQCTIGQLSEWIFESNDTFPDADKAICTMPKSLAGIPVDKALFKLFKICLTPLDFYDYLFFVIVGFTIFISGVIVASIAGIVMVYFERKKKFTEDEDEMEMTQFQSMRANMRFMNIST